MSAMPGRDLGEVGQPIFYADDLRVGDWMTLGDLAPTEAEIIEFAQRYDPLPLHVDPVVAAASPFGGIIASAMHTMSLYASLASTRFIPRLALVAGKGIESARFPTPVRPDDVLSARIEVLEVRPREGRSDLLSRATMTSTAGVVLDFVSITVVRSRPVLAP